MELWKELLISGLQNENYHFDYISDKKLIKIINDKCYEVLLQSKKIIEDDSLTDKDCFIKMEELLCVLEKNNIFFNRHDFG